MWPLRGEALSRTIEAEAVLTDLYTETLNQWVVSLQPFVLPTLTAAALPPDPDAVAQNQGVLDRLLDKLILAGLSILWALSLLESSEGMEIDLPDLDLSITPPKVNPVVLRAITRTTDFTADQVETANVQVERSSVLKAAREDFVSSQRELVAATPTLVRDKVAAAVRDAPATQTTDAVGVEVTITRQREAALDVLTPGSEAVRDVARFQGYQAAGVQNAAVVTAAKLSEDADILEKTWIATIDGKTRHTHFAADGQRTPLTGTFTVGAAQLQFPADPAGPAAEVKNCRCRVGILAADEDIPDEVDRHTERLNGRDSVQINRQGSQKDEIDRREREGTIRARDDEDGIGRTAAGGWVAPSEQEYAMAENDEGETFRTFTDQPIAFIGIETSDGRMLQKGIDLSVRTPPLPMMWTKQSGMGHMDAYTVGVIESSRIDGDVVRGSGYLLNSAEADEAFEQCSHKVSRPSVDLAAAEWILVDENGKEVSEEDWWDMPMDAKVVQAMTAAELIGATLVATPAFGDTMLEFDADRSSRTAAVVASAAEAFRPRVYAAELFADPKLTEPTELQMDPTTGRIFGHLACFGACHRSIQAQCVVAPRSKNDYADFHTSPSVLLDDGSRLAVGRLTVGTGHAPDTLAAGPALAHYDNTGSCWALVRVYEDEHGIAFSGVAAPWATPEQVEMGLAAPLSGDWRDRGNGLELIAALSVNTPGFAVRGRTDSMGRPAALVASLGPAPTTKRDENVGNLSLTDIGEIVSKAVTAALTQRDEDTELDALLAEADDVVGPPPTPKTVEDEIAELLAEAGA